MALSASDYREQLQALLPQGAAWPRHAGALLTRVLGALALELARIDARARLLIREAVPSSTSEMLADWERVVGLPDNCSGLLAEGQEARRNDVVSKLISQGGQSRAYFQSLAETMGFSVQIEEYRPFRVGKSVVGQSLTNGGWRFTWRVAAPPTTLRKFCTGRSAVGEPLASWGNAGLECRIRAYKPAHTRVVFTYGATGPRALLQEETGALLINEGNTGIFMESV